MLSDSELRTRARACIERDGPIFPNPPTDRDAADDLVQYWMDEGLV